MNGYFPKIKFFTKSGYFPKKVDILQKKVDIWTKGGYFTKKRIFHKNVDILPKRGNSTKKWIFQKNGYFYKLKSEIWSNRKTFKIHLVVASMRFTSKTRINFKSKSSRLFPQRKFSRTLQNFGNAQLHAWKSFKIAATLAQGNLTVAFCFL